MSSKGKAERDLCYEPMKEALIEHFADIPPEERSVKHVCRYRSSTDTLTIVQTELPRARSRRWSWSTGLGRGESRWVVQVYDSAAPEEADCMQALLARGTSSLIICC